METILYVATNNGVLSFFREVGSKGWRLIGSGLQGVDVKCIAADPSNRSTAYAGSSNGIIYATENKGSSWSQISKLDGKIWCIETRMIEENAHFYAGIEPAKLFLSLDGCRLWHELATLQNTPSAKEWYSPWGPADLSTIVFDPKDIRGMYVGIEVGGALKSADEGASWKEVSSGVDKDIHCLAVNYYNPKIIFAATGGGIYRTVTAGKLWVDVGTGIDLHYAVSVAIHPAKPGITYLAIAMAPPGNQALLYKSEDYGETWNLLHNGLPYPMLSGVRRKSLIVNPAAPAEVYIGTSDGLVFYSPNEGMKWDQIVSAPALINALACVSLAGS